MSSGLQGHFSFTNLSALQYARHAVQLIVFLFLNAKIFGLKADFPVIVPYLWPSGAPFSAAHGAFDAFEYTLAKGIIPILVLGVIYLTAITVGRVLCGWACPFGMIQDFLSYIPFFKKQKVNNYYQGQLKDLKWAVIGYSVVLAAIVGIRRQNLPNAYPLGPFSDGPFAVISPASTIFAYIPWMMMWNPNTLATAGLVAWVKLALFVLLLVPCLYVPRFFCRFFCPLGAMMEPIMKYKMLRIARVSKGTKEEVNKLLQDVCPMGVTLESEQATVLTHGGCVHCGRCLTDVGAKHLQQQFEVVK